MKETVTLSQTELKRMLVLQRVLEGQVGALPLMTPGTPGDPVGYPAGRIRFCPWVYSFSLFEHFQEQLSHLALELTFSLRYDNMII
ncbi:hypothetical protein G7K71_06845 [Desulfofundulus sp. TPOSR]|uniref:hypothetical protein n=1 Tax=Desulfofundulus sp. TPOSR TaxID=2714340 RepID=UPI00140C715E|nr:hypothetical protein [Desulfofundulus sp. TPOSR]NHM26706.1 hypothetical protein [Desulfofundulus sp. TPOSR]